MSTKLSSNTMNLLKISSIVFGLVLLASVGIQQSSYADVAAPKKQQDMGFASDEVFCRHGLFKIYKQTTNDAACVTPESAKRMESLGWAKTIDPKKLQTFQQTIADRQPIGTVKEIDILPVMEKPTKATSQLRTISYYYVFEACAGPSTIRAPEVAIVSDSQVKYVKLSQNMLADSCETNSANINAKNPQSISAFFTNDGSITERITVMEDKIKELQDKIRTETLGFADLENKVSPEIRTQKIVNLRNELNDAREEINRYLFALHVNSAKPGVLPFEAPKSFLGNPIKGVLADIISVSETVSKTGKYDVAFQICTSNQMLRIPIAEIKSDEETVRVKLSDKIVANSCQLTGTKIAASDPESIQISMADSQEKSGLISGIEKEISQLQDYISENKKKLSEIVYEIPKPENYEEIVNEISEDIVKTRNTINELKSDLFRILNQLYD